MQTLERNIPERERSEEDTLVDTLEKRIHVVNLTAMDNLIMPKLELTVRLLLSLKLLSTQLENVAL